MAGRTLRRGATLVGALAVAVGVSIAPASAAPYPPVPVTSSPQGPVVGVATPVNPGAIGITPAPRGPGGVAIAPGSFPVQAQTGSAPPADSSDDAGGEWGVAAVTVAALASVGAVAWRRRTA